MARACALPTITDDRALGGAVIERSLRFNREHSDHLTYTPASASSDRTKVTISAWVKKCSNNRGEYMIAHAGTTNNNRAQLRFYTSSGYDNISFSARTSGSWILQPLLNHQEVRVWNGLIIVNIKLVKEDMTIQATWMVT